MNFSSRDFMEKAFNFYSDGKFYRYSTSIDNSECHGPEGEVPLRAIEKPNECVRGFTIINCGIMQRTGEEGKIKIQVLTQCDIKVSIPAFMINSFIPKVTKAWYDNVVMFYNKNHKLI